MDDEEFDEFRDDLADEDWQALGAAGDRLAQSQDREAEIAGLVCHRRNQGAEGITSS